MASWPTTAHHPRTWAPRGRRRAGGGPGSTRAPTRTAARGVRLLAAGPEAAHASLAVLRGPAALGVGHQQRVVRRAVRRCRGPAESAEGALLVAATPQDVHAEEALFLSSPRSWSFAPVPPAVYASTSGPTPFSGPSNRRGVDTGRSRILHAPGPRSRNGCPGPPLCAAAVSVDASSTSTPTRPRRASVARPWSHSAPRRERPATSPQVAPPRCPDRPVHRRDGRPRPARARLD